LLWLVIVLVGLVLIVLLTLFGRGQRSQPVVPPLTVPVSEDAVRMNDQLSELGDQFSQVMEHQRDAGPLLEKLEALAERHPDTAAVHTLRGQVLMYAGRWEASLAALQASLEHDPKQPGIHQLAGSVAAQLELLDTAQDHYQQALDLEPEVGAHAIFLANIQHKMGLDHEANITLLQAIRRDSDLHGAYALLSDIYATQGKLDLAMQQIQRALEATADLPEQARTVYSIKKASLLRKQQQPAESLGVLNALPLTAQLRPDVMRDTAASWSMLEKPAMAAEVYEHALTRDPSSDHAAAQAAHWRLEAGEPNAASRHLKALRRINPRHPDIPTLDKRLKHG